jgi:hypothetical protein
VLARRHRSPRPFSPCTCNEALMIWPRRGRLAKGGVRHSASFLEQCEGREMLSVAPLFAAAAPKKKAGCRADTRLLWPCGCCERGAALRSPHNGSVCRLAERTFKLGAAKVIVYRPCFVHRGVVGRKGWLGAWSVAASQSHPYKHIPVPPNTPSARISSRLC